MSKNNKSNTVSINKGMFAIIVILVALLAMFAIDVVAIYMSDTKTLTGKTDNTLSDTSKGNSSAISSSDLMEIKSIIGAGTFDRYSLNFLLDKSSINDITNDEKLFYVSNGIDTDNYKYGETLSKEEFKKLYNNSVFSNLEYTDDDIKENGVTVFSYDKSSGVYKFEPDYTDNYGTIYTRAVYTYDVDNYIKGDKYIVSFKYLFANDYDFEKGTTGITLDEYLHNGGTILYGSYSDAKNGANDKDKSAVNSVGRLGSYWESSSPFLNSYAMKNYSDIKDKLDTYTYTFEKKDGHFVITDFSVEHSK